jgi:hypothetical protein
MQNFVGYVPGCVLAKKLEVLGEISRQFVGKVVHLRGSRGIRIAIHADVYSTEAGSPALTIRTSPENDDQATRRGRVILRE